MSMSISPQDVVGRLAAQSDTIGRLAKDGGAFAAVFAAFESRDPDAFRWVLERLEMLPECDLICEWVRVKLGVLRCAEICGGPRVEGEPPTPRDLAQAIVRLASHERLLRRVVDAVSCGDPRDYREAIAELGLERFCHLICRWVYTVIYDRVCEVVCAPQRVFLPDPAADIHAAAKVLGRLVHDEALFAAIGRSAATLDGPALQAALNGAGIAGECEIICRLVCVWRGAWVCGELCELAPPILRGVHAVEEARSFALAAAPLASQARVLGDLVAAAERADAKAYGAIVDRFGLAPYCAQLCAWVTSVTCSEFCVVVCHAQADDPLFNTVGYFNILSDIDPATGLTNKALSYPGLYYGGGPNFAFWSQLTLGGFCPSFSPASASTPMQYRFLYDAGSGPLPVTGDMVYPILAGSRWVAWPVNVGGLASASTVQTAQSVVICPAPAPADPLPPAPNTVWSPPPPAYIAPDVEGWVTVDPNAAGEGFSTLLCFDTTKVVPGGAANPGVAAGTAVPAAAQRTGADLAITFEATRVGLTTIDFSNTLNKIRINNWSEVNELDFVQFSTGCCTPIDLTLGVQVTFDHEQMASGDWGLSITSCSPSAPGGIGLSTGLAAGITATQTTLATTGGGAPPTPFEATVIATGETMTVTAVSGNTWTVTRGGSAAAAPAGAAIWASSPGLAFTSREGVGTIVEDTSAWSACSYTANLDTRPGLTSGSIDYQGTPNSLTFCICGH